MKTRLLISISLVFLVLSILSKTFAQQTQLPDLMPNSPNTEAMQQYGTYPVGKYTGVPSISIPLYIIKSGDIEVPISLSYHASGIKVAQEASWVGLGWSLNAGGSLSKQKRSFDDFGHFEPNRTYHFRDSIIELTEDNKNNLNLTSDQLLQYFEEDRRDFFPDLYYYNYLGYSGQFIFDDFPKGVSLKRGDGLQFNVQNYGNNGAQLDNLEWRVKDLKGSTYSFDRSVEKDILTTDLLSGNPGFETTIGSWLLTNIKSVTNKEVSFSYDFLGVLQTPHFESYNTTLLINSIIVDPPAGIDLSVFDHHMPASGYGSNIASTEHIDDYNLELIDFDEGYVSFITTDRSDLNYNINSGKKLSRIEIYRKTNGGLDGELVKGFEFSYTYVNTDQDHTGHIYKKLCLQSVQEFNIVSGVRVNKNPYTFEYTERPSEITPIAKNSDLTDHWGYWGKSENVTSMLQHSDLDINAENLTSSDPPEIITNERHEYGTEFWGNHPVIDTLVARFLSNKLYLPGHNLLNTEYLNHQVDTVLNKLYSLKSITYPTKGKTAFELETNRYSNYYPKYSAPGFFALRGEGVPAPIVTQLPEGPEMPVFGNFDEKNIEIHNHFGNTNTGFSDSFTLTYPTRVRLEFASNIVTAGAKGILKRQDGSKIIEFIADQSVPEYTTSFKSVQGVKLPPGDYTIEIQNSSSSSSSELKVSYVHYEQFSITDPETVGEFDYQLGGGLRVKEISNYNSNGDLLETTNYNYTREGYQFENAVPDQVSPIVTRSSGKLLSPIKYAKAKIHTYNTTQEIAGTGGQHTNFEMQMISTAKSFSSSPIIPVASSANGKSIGYDQVTVSKIDSQGNHLGKTVYYYQNQLETVADYGTTIPNEVHLDNGQLLKRETYNSSGVLLSKSENNYSLDSYQPYMYGLSRSYDNQEDHKSVECGSLPVCEEYFNYGVKYSDYKIKSEWWHLDQTIDTTYSTIGTNPIAKTTNYIYNTNSKNYQPSKVVVATSDSKPTITKTLYPDDIKTATTLQDDSFIIGGGLNNLHATHRLRDDDLHQMATPVQTETYVDKDNDGVADSNELISLQRTNFYEPHTDLVLPKEVQTLKGVYNSTTNTLEDRIVYHVYDDTGNPIELSKADGTHIVYVWGYNSEYPVAKIENATKSQVDALNLNTNLINNTGTSDSAMRSELHKIRTGLSNAMVTTYTYAPLIGLTSVTDPKGYTMYYEYDAFNRLEFVKDADDNILSKNEYNYKQ